jgi:hypothetical protein
MYSFEECMHIKHARSFWYKPFDEIFKRKQGTTPSKMIQSNCPENM